MKYNQFFLQEMSIWVILNNQYFFSNWLYYGIKTAFEIAKTVQSKIGTLSLKSFRFVL